MRNPFKRNHQARTRVLEIPRVTLSHEVSVVHSHKPRPMPNQVEVKFINSMNEEYRTPGFTLYGQPTQRLFMPPVIIRDQPWTHIELTFYYPNDRD